MNKEVLSENPRIEIWQGDCLDILKTIPDNSIDCIVTDPPYKISVKGKKIKRTYYHYNWKRKNDIGLDFGVWDRYWKSDEEYFLWTEKWFAECVRILKSGSWIYIFFDKQKTGLFDLWLAPKYGMKSRCIYVWIKTNPVPSFRKVNWNSGTEHIWVGSKGEAKLKNFLAQKRMANYFISSNASAWKETEHPTEKSIVLISHLLEVNTNKGDTVLDPFMGSGTTGVACANLNRNFIGIEKEQGYYEIAKHRIKKACNNQPLL